MIDTADTVHTVHTGDTADTGDTGDKGDTADTADTVHTADTADTAHTADTADTALVSDSYIHQKLRSHCHMKTELTIQRTLRTVHDDRQGANNDMYTNTYKKIFLWFIIFQLVIQ